VAKIVFLGAILAAIIYMARLVLLADKRQREEIAAYEEAVRLGYGSYEDDGLWNGRDQFVWRVK
jgi:hypothetical protein